MQRGLCAIAELLVYTYICRFYTIFYAISGSDIRSRKSITVPNLDKISPSAAEIKLLPVPENGRQPYSNSICGFDFGLYVVIDMPFCICLPNMVQIGQFAADL